MNDLQAEINDTKSTIAMLQSRLVSLERTQKYGAIADKTLPEIAEILYTIKTSGGRPEWTAVVVDILTELRAAWSIGDHQELT